MLQDQLVQIDAGNPQGNAPAALQNELTQLKVLLAANPELATLEAAPVAPENTPVPEQPLAPVTEAPVDTPVPQPDPVSPAVPPALDTPEAAQAETEVGEVPDTDTDLARALARNTSIQEELDASRHQYDVLQGKYNKEVPGQAQELREARQKITDLEAAAQQPLSYEELQERYGLSEEALAAGPDLLNTVLKMTNHEMRSFFQQLKDQNKQEMADMRAEHEGQTHYMFLSQLQALTPRYHEINDSQGFSDFLDEDVEFTQFTRRDFLDAAVERQDAAAVAKFFTTYEDQLPPASNRPSIASQVQLPRAAQPPPGQPQPKPIVSMAGCAEALRQTRSANPQVAAAATKQLNAAVAAAVNGEADIRD